MADVRVIEWEDADWRGFVREVHQRTGDLTPLMADISELLVETTQARFDTGIAPDGTPWEPVKRGGKPLVLNGFMRDGIAGDHGSDFAEVFSTSKQAPWHQDGTDGPYRILPTSAKALNIPGVGPRKSAMHPGLVARPFIGISDDDADAIGRLTAEYLVDK